MVIQRNWKIASNATNETLQPTTSSSDDSNSSWQTISNSGHSGNVANSNNTNATATATSTVFKSSASNSQMAESVALALKHRYNGRSYAHQSNAESAIRSMEMMRFNIQECFDKEIDTIVRKYIDNFFKPALKNVKENLGETSISGDCLQKMTCTLLENSKLQYSRSPQSQVVIKTENPSHGYNIYHQSQEQMVTVKTEPLKRKEHPSTGNDTDHQHHHPHNLHDQQPIKRLQTNIQLKCVGRTKPIIWNVSYLNTDTLFSLDFKANRLFGFSESGKERLASKHSELIRYLPDANDREWMFQQKLITQNYKNGRFLLLVHEELMKLSHTDEYRTRNVRPNDLEGFKLPEFIINKMKIFFTELSHRSQLSTLANLKSTTIGGQTISLPSTTSTITLTSLSNIKPRSSLSSSHATLSALLSNSVENNSAGQDSSTTMATENTAGIIKKECC